MKTPLQELIDELDKMLITTTDPSKRTTILDCRRKATYFIENEKRMVINAFNDGYSECENYSQDRTTTADKYYNEKFSK